MESTSKAGGRPTKIEKERKRIAELLAEGKDQNGEPIEEANVLSETKNIKKSVEQTGADFSVSQLNEELENATLGNGGAAKSSAPKEPTTLENSDLTHPKKEDPNYIKTEGHNRFSETMIENESDANKAATGPSNATKSTNGPAAQTQAKDFEEPLINNTGAPAEKTEAEKKAESKPINPEFEKLSQTEKKEQVELFADAILTNYAQLLPIIPKMICQYNMGKMEMLDMDGVIRLSMVIDRNEDGELTLKEHCFNFNAEVDEIFVVTDEMKEQIRGPLIAVLMEKGIAPTPMTTLLIAIGSQALMMIIATFKMLARKQSDMKKFEKFRKDELELERTTHIKEQHHPQPEVKITRSETPAPANPVSMEDVLGSKEKGLVTIKSGNDNEVKFEDVIPE